MPENDQYPDKSDRKERPLSVVILVGLVVVAAILVVVWEFSS